MTPEDIDVPSTSGRLHSEFVSLLFLQDHGETDRFFAVSGVQFPQHDRDQFHYLRVVFSFFRCSSPPHNPVSVNLDRTHEGRWVLCKENNDWKTGDFGKIGTKNRLSHRLPQSNW